MIAKKGKAHNIGEKITIPAIKEVIGTVMKNQFWKNAIKWQYSAKKNSWNSRWCGKTLVSELQDSKLSLQLDESTSGRSNLLMAYVRYYNQSQKNIIDKLTKINK